MVNPFTVSLFERTQAELEEFLLFSIIVAGKTAVIQARALENFLGKDRVKSPFEQIREWFEDGTLLDRMKLARLGKYSVIYDSFSALSINNPDLTKITRQELESYKGVGPKTSRFFLLHSRKNVELIVFDTHLSKWFGERNLIPFKGTPNKSQYEKYESVCVDYLKTVEGVVNFAEFDLRIWVSKTKTSPL